MFLLGHIVGWIWLLVTVIVGLTRKSAKSANRFLILSRIGYVLIIVTGVYLATKTFSGNWWLTLIKAVLGIGMIGIIEIAFARQQESQLKRPVLVLLGVVMIATVVCGALLHWQLTGNWV